MPPEVDLTRCVHGTFVDGYSVRCELPWTHVNTGSAHCKTLANEVKVYWNDEDYEPL